VNLAEVYAMMKTNYKGVKKPGEKPQTMPDYACSQGTMLRLDP